MGVINITCPGCGIILEAEEKYLGLKVACTECEHKFTLWNPEESLPCYPDMLEKIKPGIVAKAGLPLSFQSPLFTHEQLAIALSEKDSKRIFHYSYPLLRPTKEGVDIDGNRRYWIDTVDIWGESYVMCKEWFDYNRKLLIQWLRQMGVSYTELKNACMNLSMVQEVEDLSLKATFTLASPPITLAYTKPEKITIGDKSFSVVSWKQVLQNFVEFIYATDKAKLLSFIGKQFAKSTKRVPLQKNMDCLVSGAKIAPGLYLELNYSSESIVKLAIEFAITFGIDLSSVSVQYSYPKHVKKRSAVTQQSGNLLPSIRFMDNVKSLVESQESIAYEHETFISNISSFIAVLLQDFSAGFEFNNSSVRLLESAVGRPCPESMQKELKRKMFKRYDGIYLLPEMVADGETLGAIKHRIEEYFDQFHAFSLPVLYGEFEGALHALTNPDSDFRLFLLEAILPEFPEGGKVFGKLQKQICIPSSLEEQDVLDFLAERIREMLQQSGDAVLNEELLAELPCLNADAVEMIIREQLPEVVEIIVDELRYWKLLEFFCLPDELGDELLQIIENIEQQNKTPSLQMITDRLAEQYGDDFRETYALGDDDVLRQVIIKTIREEKYGWKGNLLVRNGSGHGMNVADEFLQGQHGIFHEKDFFDYSSEFRGMENNNMLICSYLRPRCIRLDQCHWLGLADFDRQSDFADEIAQGLTQELRSRLENRPFLPLGTLPDAFFSELPPLHIQGNVFYWNAYLLASIAEHKLTGLQVVNTEPSPYTVTAMLVPANSDYDGDVIDFVFRTLRSERRQFATADQVFDYLKNNQVRMTKSQKLLGRINAFWGFQ